MVQALVQYTDSGVNVSCVTGCSIPCRAKSLAIQTMLHLLNFSIENVVVQLECERNQLLRASKSEETNCNAPPSDHNATMVIQLRSFEFLSGLDRLSSTARVVSWAEIKVCREYALMKTEERPNNKVWFLAACL